MRRIGKIILFCFALILLGVTSFQWIQRFQETSESENTYSELRETVYTIKEMEEQESKDPERENRFRNLYSLYWENTDCLGWIQIPDTKIDYPVMQNLEEPDYYLKRDFYGKKSSFGAIYMDAACSLEDSKNLILYGHHMKNGDMFASLDSYLSEDFWKDHSQIQFDSISGIHDYQIIGAFKITENEFTELQDMILFPTEYHFHLFEDFLEEHRFYDTEVPYTYEDSFLTLMTCEYTTKNGRLFVFAKKMED